MKRLLLIFGLGLFAIGLFAQAPPTPTNNFQYGLGLGIKKAGETPTGYGLAIYGGTSGKVIFNVPAVAGTNYIGFPAKTGTVLLDVDTVDISSVAVMLYADTLLVTAAYTLVLADVGRNIRVRSATHTRITIPASATVAFPLGTTINFKMDSTGTVKFVYPSGYLCAELDSTTINNKGGWATLIKRTSDRWDLLGSLLN